MIESGLYVVATPIGNLEDISYRAVRILAEVDCIAAEDTRHTLNLLNHYGVKTLLQAMHEHNETQMLPKLTGMLEAGKSLALVSDAGTPLISDPGFQLVREARKLGLPVFAVPGPSAVTAALSISGLPTNRFAFEGFLPAKSAARKAALERLKMASQTLVFFESSHRIEESLADMSGMLGADREAVLCRELTKRFETVIAGSLRDVHARVAADAHQRKGEFVVLVGGRGSQPDDDVQSALELAEALLEYLSTSQAARVAAKITGTPRRDIYSALEKQSRNA